MLEMEGGIVVGFSGGGGAVGGFKRLGMRKPRCYSSNDFVSAFGVCAGFGTTGMCMGNSLGDGCAMMMALGLGFWWLWAAKLSRSRRDPF